MSVAKYNIFYADDDQDDQEIFREIVAEINEHIYIFSQKNGQELMELLKTPPPSPHVIFLDLNMPVKNGYDVLREIRQAEGTKNLPVIIFSTSNDEDNIQLTKTMGATLYVHKPNSYTELKDTLRHLLSVDWDNYNTKDKDFLYTANTIL